MDVVMEGWGNPVFHPIGPETSVYLYNFIGEFGACCVWDTPKLAAFWTPANKNYTTHAKRVNSLKIISAYPRFPSPFMCQRSSRFPSRWLHISSIITHGNRNQPEALLSPHFLDPHVGQNMVALHKYASRFFSTPLLQSLSSETLATSTPVPRQKRHTSAAWVVGRVQIVLVPTPAPCETLSHPRVLKRRWVGPSFRLW
jgi:hypothetical protein